MTAQHTTNFDPEAVQPAVAVPRGEGPTVLWTLALVAGLSALSARALEPALPGIWVGVDHIITGVKLIGAVASQLFAVASTAVIIGLVLSTVKSSLPAYLRAFSVGAGVLTILAVMIASAVRLPEMSRLVLAGTTALLAILCIQLSARLFSLRAASLVLGFVALAGVVRIPTIVLTELGQAADADTFVLLARIAATIASLLEIAAVLVAVVWVMSAGRARAKPNAKTARWPRGVAVGAVVTLAVVTTYLAALGGELEASKSLLLISRSWRELLTNPAPYTPELARVFVEVTRYALVATVLILRPRGPLMSAAVAFGLVAGGALEVPLCAASLVIGALALALHPGPDLRHDRPAQ